MYGLYPVEHVVHVVAVGDAQTEQPDTRHTGSHVVNKAEGAYPVEHEAH